MKTLLFLFTLTVSITNLQATDKYTAAMQKNIESIYQAETLEDYQTTVNSFERIAQGEKTKWEPYYYASFGYIMMSMNSQDNTQKDSYLDLAVKSLDQAKKLKPEDSEITALEGFIVMMRVAADPASRGAQLSGFSMQLFGKALALDPNNPRALALLAQMQYGSAQFF
ncbi:MAG: hypothetical protein HC811_13715 [Flammeovirgaceae bacterium]|nr:hypothetical protein [Flammeovirgaceae bacterium]